MPDFPSTLPTPRKPGEVIPVTKEELEQITFKTHAQWKIQILRLEETATLPTRTYPDDVGWDVYAHLISETGRPNRMLIDIGATRKVPTGIVAVAPPGYFLQLCSRSGLAGSRSVFIPNGPGIIDPGFRGEILVQLYNGGHVAHWIEHGDRVGQLILLPLPSTAIVEIDVLPEGTRGEKGFGSSGP